MINYYNMGNIITCSKNKLNDKQCPYCKFIFESKKAKKKHMKNCIYNPKIDIHAYTLYDIDSEFTGF